MSSARLKDYFTLAFCLLLGGGVILACQEFPRAHGSQGFGQGPAFYPQVLAWALIGLGAASFLTHSRRPTQPPAPDSAGQGEAGARPEEPAHYGLVAGVAALTLADILVMQYFGFFAAGLLLMLAMTRLVRPPRGIRAWGLDLLFSAGMVVLIYLVFEVSIKIQLPRGAFFS